MYIVPKITDYQVEKKKWGTNIGEWYKPFIRFNNYIGFILKCNPISENTKHFKSCTR